MSPDPYPLRARAYERAILALPDEIRGGAAWPLTMGRYLCFLRVFRALAPDAPEPVLSMPGDAGEPTAAELDAHAFAVTADTDYLRRAVFFAAGIDAIVLGAIGGFDPADRATLAARHAIDAADLRACGVDILPRPGGQNHPLPEEFRAFPPGHAGLVHVAATATHWPLDYLLWSLPLPALLVHAHCHWVGQGADCAPRGYRDAKRRDIAARLSADAPDPDADIADMLDEGEWGDMPN